MKKKTDENLKKQDFINFIRKESLAVSDDYAVDLGKEIYSFENDFYIQFVKESV